jgi:hypothetical protein
MAPPVFSRMIVGMGSQWNFPSLSFILLLKSPTYPWLLLPLQKQSAIYLQSVQLASVNSGFWLAPIDADVAKWDYACWGKWHLDIYLGRPFILFQKAYKHLKGSSGAHPIFKWIWKSSCQHKHKVFFWLLIQDRLNTCNILKRKHFHLPSFDCPLCESSQEETRGHLFL